MAELARMTLDNGGTILIEADAESSGPVQAGRFGKAIHDMPLSLSATLESVGEVAKTVLDHLRQASPASVEVEFGVDLAFEAGAVITRAKTNSHLKVTMTWSREQHHHKQHDDQQSEQLG